MVRWAGGGGAEGRVGGWAGERAAPGVSVCGLRGAAVDWPRRAAGHCG